MTSKRKYELYQETELEKLIREELVRSAIEEEITFGETDVQKTARELHEQGLNVFPIPYGKKKPVYKWKRLQFYRLHPTDRHSGIHSLFQGVTNLAVACGGISGNLCVIDLETVEAFEYHLSMLQKRNIPIFSSKTARGGHIWLRIIEGAVSGIPSGKFMDGEIRGEGQYIVAPPSLHPSGVKYQWHIREVEAPPLVSMTAIDWLFDLEGDRIPLTLASKTKRKIRISTSRLSKATEYYLDYGGYTPQGERNSRLFKAACDFTGNQIPKEKALKQLTPIAAQSGLEVEEIEYVIDSAYSKPRYPARQRVSTQQNNFPYWLVAKIFTENYFWTGKTAVTDRMVMLALADKLALDSDRKGVFKASERELAENGRFSTKTIHRALQRLKGNNESGTVFIEHVGKDEDSGTFLWQFSEHVRFEGRKLLHKLYPQGIDEWMSDKIDEKNPLTTSVRTIRNSRYGVLSVNSDAYERGKDAPGKTGKIVHECLLQVYPSALSVKEIASKTHLTPRQVYGVLAPHKLLVTSGVVQKQGKGWIAPPTTKEELDEKIAAPAGNLGRGDKRTQQSIAARGRFLGRYIWYIREKTDPYFPGYRPDKNWKARKRSKRRN